MKRFAVFKWSLFLVLFVGFDTNVYADDIIGSNNEVGISDNSIHNTYEIIDIQESDAYYSIPPLSSESGNVLFGIPVLSKNVNVTNQIFDTEQIMIPPPTYYYYDGSYSGNIPLVNYYRSNNYIYAFYYGTVYYYY
ncbi:MAG: hypothetical protein LBQ68_06590 [Clostridiales bacterium]|jgi:hypothetical protein|nr:hypothetical protein [Clostridiales bacterium]